MNYQIQNDRITLTVSSFGAEMQSIRMEGREYLWNGDETYWLDRAPVLFPYVGRFTEGKYRFSGRDYDMNIHGFAKESEFSLVEHTEDQLVFELKDSEKTYAIYPFHFCFRVSYQLVDQEIRIGYLVKNLSDKMMYFGVGGHPGFRLPLEDGACFEDYYLEFESECCPDRVGHTETCFLSGNNLPYLLEDNRRLRMRHDLFDDDAVVLQNVSDRVTLKKENGTHQVTLHYPKLPYLGIWHAPKTTAPYVCIEPWTSLPSRQGIVEDIQCKPDLVRLEHDNEYVNYWSIKIE